MGISLSKTQENKINLKNVAQNKKKVKQSIPVFQFYSFVKTMLTFFIFRSTNANVINFLKIKIYLQKTLQQTKLICNVLKGKNDY